MAKKSVRNVTRRILMPLDFVYEVPLPMTDDEAEKAVPSEPQNLGYVKNGVRLKAIMQATQAQRSVKESTGMDHPPLFPGAMLLATSETGLGAYVEVYGGKVTRVSVDGHVSVEVLDHDDLEACDAEHEDDRLEMEATQDFIEKGLADGTLYVAY